MTKSMILPFIAVLALVTKAVLGVDISAELQDQIANGIVILGGAGYVVYGIFKNHKKEGDK